MFRQFVYSLLAAIVLSLNLSCTDIDRGKEGIFTTPPTGSVRESAKDTFEFNMNHKKRDKLLGLSVIWGKDDSGGIIYVDSLPLPLLEQLFNERFIDPNDRQNFAPSAKEFLDFMRKHPAAVAHGYVVSPNREDYRVSIEGLFVRRKDVTPELRQEFKKFCKGADELNLNGNLSSWWD